MENDPQFRPGFRISEIDVGVLLLGFAVSPLLGRLNDILGLSALLTIAHFFLFCNVLRLGRVLELLWAVTFTGLVASTLLYRMPSWDLTVLLTLCVTAVVSTIQVMRPSYHGVLWKRLNPSLPQWWERHLAANK